MAVYTELNKPFLKELADDYSLGRITSANAIPQGSINSNYLIDAANPDEEIINALRPAMATIPGSMLLCASSPYARRGALWKAYRRHWGQPGRVLVWQADTRTMNPTVPEEVIAEAYESDPASAAVEYGAEFRVDLEGYVSREVVDALVMPGRHELPPLSDVSYMGFVDPSGGSSDSR